MNPIFRDRVEAGRQLAGALMQYANQPDVIVLGLPRGGVVVAFEVARALCAPLDVFIVRKLGAPGQPELAMGAIASGGIRVLNTEVMQALNIPMETIDAASAKEERELKRRERAYRVSGSEPQVYGKTVLLIDDGIATGSTIRAAIRALRAQRPRRLIVGVPTAAASTCRELLPEVDGLVALLTPESFGGVGEWYEDFRQTSDAEVTAALDRSRENPPFPRPGSAPDLPRAFDITEIKEAAEALRESEQRARDLVEALPAAVYTTDAAGRITLYNRAAAELWGMNPTLGSDLWCGSWRLYQPDGTPMAHEDCPMARALKSNQPVRGEEAIAERPDGARVSFVPYPTPLRDASGALIGAVNMLVDITDRKRSEEALRKSEQDLAQALEFHQAVMANMGEGLYAVDAQGLVTYMNPAAERLFGWSSGELLGRKMHDTTHYKRPGGSPFPVEEGAVMQVLKNGVALVGSEDVFIRKDGSFFPVVYSISPLRAEGAIVGLVVVFRDVTAEKQAQEALEESRARLEEIVASAMDAIITVDAGQQVVLFNAAAEKMFGCPAAEALGSPIERFIPTRIRKVPARHAWGIGATGATGRAAGAPGELSALRANGEEFPIEASVSQVEVRGRKLFTVILRDVTERALAEAAAALRARQQAAVADLNRHALEGRDLDRLTNDAVTLVAQVLGVEFAKMLELAPMGHELMLRAGVGWREGCVGVRKEPMGHESQAGYTLLSSAPVVTEDLAHETRFRAADLLIEHGVVSGMSAIIHGKIKPYGVLGAHTTSQRRFSGDDVHFLQSIADVLAAAIERRELEEELLAIAGREQRRIGQDLHDGLCQHLAGVEFRTEALARDLAGDPAAREEAEKIGALIRDGTRQARMLARGLAPVELEKNGLMSALAALAESSAHLYRIECRFACMRPVLVTNEAVATHLYRIAQEAISNAVRHGRAKSIALALRLAGEEAVLTVANDGAPLPAELRRSGGMGLRIMRYRAELIGGVLRLGSAAQGKTELSCTFKPH
jgi:putative phosphoribosyl transferase